MMSTPVRPTGTETGGPTGPVTTVSSDVRGLWRRSIRLRVVVATVVLSAFVVGATGWLVLRQITAGLVESRVDRAIAEATSETEGVRERLAATGATDFDPVTQVRQLAESLVARGDVRGFDVVVLGPVTVGADGGARVTTDETGVRVTPGVSPESVPQRLRARIGSQDTLAWTFTRLRHVTTESDGAAVAVGARVVLPSDGGTYGVYYLFSMAEENATLQLVRRSLMLGGAGLLVLISGTVLLVTRQVIGPVRAVREVAERIASGRLSERMRVRGEDDIARLSSSFNQMADALEQQIGQLVDLSRIQRQFVSDVSHELRTPLTTVRMAGDVLYDARDGFEPTAARSAELLQTELDRFENLLNDLLEISRFDAGAANLELAEVNLADVTRRAVQQAIGVAAGRDVTFLLDARQACVAEVDVRRIERILRNLLTNAIDYAAGMPDQRVLVAVAGDDTAVAVTVRDFGVGLEPGQEAMVFHRFWRADPARARIRGGTGLGLAIALEDAQLHGGWLQVWGASGAGAKFRLTVPTRAGGVLDVSPLPLGPDDGGHEWEVIR